MDSGGLLTGGKNYEQNRWEKNSSDQSVTRAKQQQVRGRLGHSHAFLSQDSSDS